MKKIKLENGHITIPSSPAYTKNLLRYWATERNLAHKTYASTAHYSVGHHFCHWAVCASAREPSARASGPNVQTQRIPEDKRELDAPREEDAR